MSSIAPIRLTSAGTRDNPEKVHVCKALARSSPVRKSAPRNDPDQSVGGQDGETRRMTARCNFVLDCV